MSSLDFSTEGANVSKKFEAEPGRVFIVNGVIKDAKELVTDHGVICRCVVVLKNGFVVAQKAFCLDATHHAERFLVRSYSRPVGDVVFESKDIKVIGAAEDSWMKRTLSDAKQEIERVSHLESAIVEEQTSLAVLQAFRRRSEALAGNAQQTASS